MLRNDRKCEWILYVSWNWFCTTIFLCVVASGVSCSADHREPGGEPLAVQVGWRVRWPWHCLPGCSKAPAVLPLGTQGGTTLRGEVEQEMGTGEGCGWCLHRSSYIDGLVQERRNSSALAVELRLSCTNPSTWWHHFNGLAQDCTISSVLVMEILLSSAKPSRFYLSFSSSSTSLVNGLWLKLDYCQWYCLINQILWKKKPLKPMLIGGQFFNYWQYFSIMKNLVSLCKCIM